MGTVIRLGFLGLLVYAVALLATLPADRAYAWVRPHIPSLPVQVEPFGLKGTVWDGAADALSVGGVNVGSAQWTFRPVALLAGRAAADLSLRDEHGYLHGAASVSTSGELDLADVEGRIPVNRIARHLPFLPVALEGLVSLKLDRAAMRGGRPAGIEGTVVWHQARVAAPQQLPLGDLRMKVTQAEDGVVVGRLSDGGGPLQASGEVRLEPDGTYRLRANLAARDSAQPALAESLRMLGNSDGKGGVRINFSGRL